MDDFERFNDAQRRAVTAPLHPMLILAGPGTGKTRTLVGRIVYLFRHHQIAAHRMLAVTFTNKAKEEMKHRLRQQLGDTASDLMVGTFHRFCMTVLREQYEHADLPKQFGIADENAQLLTLARVSRIQDAKSLNTVLNAISTYRLNRTNLNLGLLSVAEKWIDPYHQELRNNRLLDFDQILLFTQRLFADHPDIVEAYQQRFDAILVDEFQDTDPVQYAIMKALAWQHRNIFVVADDDQSIFAWRGAHIENIEQYTRDFGCGDEQVIVLHENYRSAQQIIDTATRLINQGPRFREKWIRAMRLPDGIRAAKPEFHAFADDETEIQFIIERIKTLLSQPSASTETPNTSPTLRYADVAILYPTHAIGQQLETKLLAAHIPCQLIKRQGIFDQPDVRKILLFLKLLSNPQDDLALEQLFELELHNDPVFQQIRSLKRQQPSFRQTLYWLSTTRVELEGISPGELARVISTTSGVVANMRTYLEEHPELRLAEVINHLCTLTRSMSANSIHRYAPQLSDPLNIPEMQTFVDRIVQAQAAQETLIICGEDTLAVQLCQALLMKYDPTRRIVSQVTSTGQPLRSVSEKSLFICLDQHSFEQYEALFSNLTGCINLSGTGFPPVVIVFKLLQALSAAAIPKAFKKYTVFDLETTSGDIRTTRIVEIGAVKVRDGQMVAEFGKLVNPEQPITQGAYNVHHIAEEDVRDQPTFAELLPGFLDFIGDDILVAHNGLAFDFPILMRQYKEVTGKTLPNRRFDTLPLARRLFPGEKASVDVLMQRFGIPASGERHRALDDTRFLAQIFERLQEVECSLNRRAEHEDLLELVALGLYVTNSDRLQPTNCGENDSVCTEERLLFRLGAWKLLSRFSELPVELQPLYHSHKPGIEALLEELTEDNTEEQRSPVEQMFSGREIALAHLKDLAASFDAEPLQDAIPHFLDHTALYNSQDELRDINAVNLLTIHSAKGLEFPVVFVSGVEKGNLPSFYAVREDGELQQKRIDEQRRLLYVALTRAKHRLIVTYVNKRGEYEKKRSQFLVELGVEVEDTEKQEDR